MGRKHIYKIGLPDWLVELIEKGKYENISQILTVQQNSYKLVHNHQIYQKNVKYKPRNNSPKKNIPVISKIINNFIYTFDTEKMLIIAELKHDENRVL